MTPQYALPKEVDDNLAYCRESLYWHTRYVHRFTMRKHQLRWVKALEDESIKRLLIIAPPKYGKSPVLVDYIGRRIGRDPNGYHCIYVSNTSRQADKYSISIRDTITLNDRYKAAYPLLKPDVNKSWSSAEWFVKRDNPEDKDPTLQSCGIYGPILGATVQEVFFDDIADEENMATAYQREKLMEWVKSTPMSRLVPGISRAIMICTRWHEEDPAGVFESEGWTVVEMPAIDDEGNSTYPEYWSLEDLAQSKIDLGTYKFELMFQNNVLPEGGSIFKHEWWRYWENGKAPWQLVGELNQPILAIVQTWDTAHKGKETNDYSGCETWAIVKGGYYLLNAWRAKLDYPKLKVAFKQMNEQFKPRYILIEDAASGQDLILEMRQDTKLPIVAIQVNKDKVARAHAVTPMIETGNVYLPKGAGWLHDWEYEHEIFPGGKNDDWVDCFDDETEVLTSEGWKWLKHLTGSETMATLNCNGVLEYQLPSAYIAKPYKGPMVSVINSKQIDLLVTPNHKLYVSAYHGANVYGEYELRSASEVGHCRFKRDAVWNASDVFEFSLPGYSNKTNRKQGVADRVLPMDLWLQFLGWFIAEGSVNREKHIRRVAISQSRSVNPDKYYEIKTCMEDLGLRVKEDKRGTALYVSDAQLARYLIEIGDDSHRRIPRFVMSLSARQQHILLRSMMLGDGADDRTYSTVSPMLADDILELLLKVGWAGTVGVKAQVGKPAINGIGRYDLNNVCISKQNLRPRVNNLNRGTATTVTRGYEGYVYCVTVPNHTLYVKRNGKPCWVGNCTTQFLNWARTHVTSGPTAPVGIPKTSIWAGLR